ncbi:MAG TPA: DMT family transporter [Streptosporangiaceae bacterium]|nr:DMT family transporter [Streptosporangiaceae bacterium]
MTGIGVQPVAVVLAGAAAVSFAIANVVQQRVAVRLRSQAAFDSAVLLKLVRRPLWLAGLAAVLVSISLQAAALGLGRLVVIEPVLASSLLFALALSAWADHRPMRPTEWLAAFATFAGLVVFLTVSQPSGGRQIAGVIPLGIAAAIAILLAVAASMMAGRFSSTRRALLLGVGGGVAAGVTDALTKTIAALIGGHRFAVFADPRLYLLVVVGLLAYTLQQNGYRAAGLAAFLPVFAVLDPAVGSLLGLVVYHERLGGGPARIGVEAAAVLAATWGIARLASSAASIEPVTSAAVPDRAQAMLLSVPIPPVAAMVVPASRPAPILPAISPVPAAVPVPASPSAAVARDET